MAINIDDFKHTPLRFLFDEKQGADLLLPRAHSLPHISPALLAAIQADEAAKATDDDEEDVVPQYQNVDMISKFMERMTQFREENVKTLEDHMCSVMYAVPLNTLRALYMMLTLYKCDANVFVNPDGTLKDRTELCSALATNLMMSRSSWMAAFVRLPAQIRLKFNELVRRLMVAVGVGGSWALIMFGPGGMLVNTVLAAITSGVAAKGWLSTGQSIMFATAFLNIVETRGFSAEDKHAVQQAMKKAHETEQDVFRFQVMNLRRIGDTRWYDMCSQLTSEPDVRQFRKDLVSSKKRWFRGRQLLAVHLFDPNGVPRTPQQSCLAFMHYKAGMLENIGGY